MSEFERQYVGYASEDIWESISEADLRKGLEGNYSDCDKIIAELEAGRMIRTPFAFYRMIADNEDYDELIESYMEAAEAAGFIRNDVELAVALACRFLERCESCCHSRAPHDAVEVAEDQGRLEIYRRSCSLCHPMRNGCRHWERLEVPEMAEVVA